MKSMNNGGIKLPCSIIKDTLNFINTSWTQFHAVEEASKILLQNKFTHLSERDEWKLNKGGK